MLKSENQGKIANFEMKSKKSIEIEKISEIA